MEPTNKQRAYAALRAIEAHQESTGDVGQGFNETALTDLLGDILHLAHLKGLEMGPILRRAEMHFSAEVERGPDDDLQ